LSEDIRQKAKERKGYYNISLIAPVSDENTREVRVAVTYSVK